MEETNAEFLPDEAVDQAEFRATILGMVDALPDAQKRGDHTMAHILIADWPDAMDIRWVSHVLGLSTHSTYRLFQNPAFPGRKENGKWLVGKADLERWLHQQKQNPDTSL